VLVRPLRGLSQQLSLLREIRRRQFDLVVSFQETSFFYAALARLSGARLTVSLQHWRTQPFYDRIVPVVPGRHEVEKYHAIAEAVLAPPESLGGLEAGEHARHLADSGPFLRPPGAMELHVSPQHRARAEAILQSVGIAPEVQPIGINPGATMEIKRWPVERFGAVGRGLARRHDAPILVLGGPGDEERAAAIAGMVPAAVSVAGRTCVGETAALLRRCRLLISGDTGPLHMAVALGVPTVGLFGPTNPRKYGPWSAQEDERQRATVLRHAGPCPECERPCVHTIRVEECLTAAEQRLGAGRRPSSPAIAERQVATGRRA
jgi:ADP-heptose:LPS heptosyltransferase